jgi:hypothetical protein
MDEPPVSVFPPVVAAPPLLLVPPLAELPPVAEEPAVLDFPLLPDEPPLSARVVGRPSPPSSHPNAVTIPTRTRPRANVFKGDLLQGVESIRKERFWITRRDRHADVVQFLSTAKTRPFSTEQQRHGHANRNRGAGYLYGGRR